MANSTTGDGSYSPNLTAGTGGTGTVSIDTGPISVDYVSSGVYSGGQNSNGQITVTGVGADVDVSDTSLYAYSRILVGQGFDSYIGDGRLYISNGATMTSTNNAGVASGSIVLGGYSNLVIGQGGVFAYGNVVVSGTGGGGEQSSLILNGGSAGFVIGSDGSTNANLRIEAGAYFRSLTGVIGAGSSGGVTTGGDGQIVVTGAGSEFKASTLSGDFLLQTDQAPIIYVGQNDGNGQLTTSSGGLVTIQNEIGDGKTAPTLFFGRDLNSTGTGQILSNSGVNITQNGPASGQGATLIVGGAGVGSVDVDSNSYINVLGDGANIVVSQGSYDGQGAPIAPPSQSLLQLYYVATVTVDSQSYGGPNGAQAIVGEGRLADGRIVVAQGAILSVRSDTDLANDYTTGRLVIGDRGNGVLAVNRDGVVNANQLVVGQSGYIANPLDNSTDLIFGDYNAAATGGGTGLVELLVTGGQITVTATDNTPNRGITLGQASGATGTLTVGAENTVTSTGGAGLITVGEFGVGVLNLNPGGAANAFSMEIGAGQGSDGDVVLSGYDLTSSTLSTLRLSNEFGDFSGQPGYAGQAGVLTIGLDAGSDGSLTINGGSLVEVINQNGTTYDAPTVRIGQYNGAVGALAVSGGYGSPTYTFYSTLRIAQTGATGDFVSSGGVGPQGPTLIIGEGGQGLATVSNQGRIELTGVAANLAVATGRRDGGGNPDTTNLLSSLTINAGSSVTVDSQSYGGSQDFTDVYGGTITANLGSRVTIATDDGTNGLITVDGAGATLSVISANQTAGDYGTGLIVVGANGGTGALVADNGGSIDARGLNVGFGADASGTTVLSNNSTLTLTGNDLTAYQGATIGRDNGLGLLVVQSGSTFTSTGGTGRLQVGREGTGQIDVLGEGDVNAFFVEVGRGAGSNGDININGDSARMTVSDAFGAFDPTTYGPRGGFLRVGRETGGDGQITVNNGGGLSVITDVNEPAATQGDGPILEIGRGAGSTGFVVVSGQSGMGDASYIRVQNYGRSNDAYVPGEYFGPELRLGREAGNGMMLIEQGAEAVVIGEGALVTIGIGIENGDFNAEPTSLFSITSGGDLLVDSRPNPDEMLPLNAAADVVIGSETGGNGRLLVTGAGSTVSIYSDNANDYYANTGTLAIGAGIAVGDRGRGVLDVFDSGVITIDGADDPFPNLTIGYGRTGETIDARGYVTVDGAGSMIQIIGTNTGSTDGYAYGAGGSIDVGSRDGSFGRLTISNGGVVSNSAINSKTQIAQNTGSTGEITVTGAGSTLFAGSLLSIGADINLASGNFFDGQSGDGTLTIADQGLVTADDAYVGATGTLSIGDAQLNANIMVRGDFFVGADNAIGVASVTGMFYQAAGLLDIEINGFNPGEYDVLDTNGTTFLNGSAITVDLSGVSNFTIGDRAEIVTSYGLGSLFVDPENIVITGATAAAGTQFAVYRDTYFGTSSEELLVLAVQQASLASVSGDLEVVAEPGGQVALTVADLVVSESGVDPALQTLTAVEVGGGQFESALNPGVAVTTFSQQDIADRLIRFVSDGSAGGSANLEFTDSVGFTASVSLNVVAPGIQNFNLGDLDGSNGVTLNGILAGDQAGLSVSDIGDINGDGISDIVVGASFADTAAGTDSGEGYVIFGVDGGLPSVFELSTLDGTNGFEFEGLGPSQLTAVNGSVEGVGDVNNDGIDDFLIGIGGVDTGGVFNVGEAFLIYGKTTAFDASLNLGALDGTNGTRLVGIDFNSLTGQLVPGLGDVNGDGIDDIGISASFGDGAAGVDSGESFVVFGADGGLGATLMLSSLDGTNGFRLEGDAPGDNAGGIGRIGDFNNDGIDDFLVGAANNDNANGLNTGNVQIIFGTTATQSPVRQLNSFTAAEGFRILGLAANDSLGSGVSDGGDINGDGIDDLIISTDSADVGGLVDVGTTYVIFGTTDDFGGSFDLSTLDGTNGFSISGSVANQRAGYTSASAGDVNGDGIEDVIIGGIGASPGGEVYVVFGSTAPFAPTVDLNTLGGVTGFTITPATPGTALGRDVSTAGDFNNDGITDIVFGANGADPDGRTNAGEAYVFYGINAAAAVAPPLIAGDLMLEVNQGQFTILTTDDLSASDDASPAGDLLYYVTNLVGGIIASTDDPGVPLSTFTQAALEAGTIALEHDNATLSGVGFDVTVTDGDGDIAGPVSLTVEVTPPNVQPEIEIARPNMAEFDANSNNFFFDPSVGEPTNQLTDFSISFFTEVDASNTTADYFLSYSNNDFDEALGVFAVNDLLNVTYNGSFIGALQIPALIDGGLHHVALVFTNNTESFQVFFDGGVVGTFDAMGLGRLRTGGELVVGEGFDGGAGRDPSEGLIGAIGSIRLHNIAQTAQDVALDATGVLSGPNPGLLRDLQVVFNEGTGEVDLRNVPGNEGPVGNLQKVGFNDIREPISTDEDVATLAPTLSIRDLDNSDGQQEVSLSVTNGVINLLDTAGLTIIAGANGTNSVTFRGISGDVTTALQQVQYIPNADFEGSDTLAVQTDDLGNSGFGGPLTDTRNFLIDVAAVNDAPVAQDDNVSTDEDTPFNGDLFADNGNGIDFDVDGTFILTEINGSPTNVGVPLNVSGGGVLTVQSDGTFSFDTNDSYNNLFDGSTASENFAYTIQDDQGAVANGFVFLTINGLNDPPIAQNDAFTTDEDTGVSGDLFADNGFGADQLVDDIIFFLTEINGDPAGVGVPVTLPDFGGTLTANFDGTFDYTPSGGADVLAAGDEVVETFTYTISDDGGATDTANVAITLNGLNDVPIAFDDTFLISEDDNRAGDLFADNGIAPDFDIDNGDTFIITAVNGDAINVGQAFSLAGGGVVTVNDDGSFTFDNNNSYQDLTDGDTLTESFTYTITDSLGAASTGTVNLQIQGVNDPPLAQNDDFQTDEDSPVIGDLFIDNGFGPDDDIDSAGFTVTAINGNAAGVGMTITLPQLGGFLTVQSDGTFEYVPGAGADALGEGEQGTETFAYKITDTEGGAATALARITVDGLNDAPFAQNDLFAVQQDDNLSGDVFADNGGGVDFDVDALDAFTITAINGDPQLIGQPIVLQGGGVLTLTDDGLFTFDNGGGYAFLGEGDTLPLSFNYEITDSQGAVADADVVIAIQGVNDAPIAIPDDAEFAEDDISGVFNLLADNGEGPDFEPEGDALRVISANGQALDGGALTFATAQGLRVQVNETGGVIIDDPNNVFDFLDDGEVVNESFTYTIRDPEGLTSQTQFTATINGSNDAPIANNDQFTVIADETLIFDPIVSAGPAGQDVDPEGTALTLVTLNGQEFSPGDVIALPSGANIAISLDGELEYRPSGAFDDLGPNETGEDIFAYEVADATGLTSSAQVRIIVEAPDVPPIANDDAVTAAEDGQTSFDLFADNGGGADQNFSDDGIRLTGINGAPAPSLSTVTLQSGAVIGVNDNGVIVYDPGELFAGLNDGETATDSFSYTITDGAGLQDEANVTVTIAGANDAPVAANDRFRTDERTAVVASLFAENGAGLDADIDSDFTITALNGDAALVGGEVTLPSGALITVQADGAVTYDPNGAFFALNDGDEAFDQLTYTITDDQGAEDTATVAFSVDGITDTIFGSNGDDLIRGTENNDDIDGLGGNDLITGLAGDDSIRGGDGVDIIRGGPDNDLLQGGAGIDRIFGESGDDRLEGGGGNDRLLGLSGNDTIVGGAGNDVVSGGGGDDLVLGSDGDDRLRGGRDNDTLIAGDGKDRLQGGTGRDSLFGQAGNDNLTGAGGADTLSGGDGIDRLFGRRGNDELTGGDGGDRFIFNLGDGFDTITDFDQGADRIRIGTGADVFADLTITQVGDDALIAFGNVRILALDENADDFTTSDFIL